MISARKTEDGYEAAPAISGRGEAADRPSEVGEEGTAGSFASLLGPTLLVIVLVIGFTLSAIANRLEFALLGLGAALVMALLRRRPGSATRLAAVAASALFFDAVLVALHEEELRLGLLYYGAPASLATPLLWLGAALLAGTALPAAWLLRRNRR